MEGFADQHVGADGTVTAAIEIGRVDVVHAELDRAAKNSAASLRITGRPAPVVSGQTHGAEAEPLDADVAAEAEFGGHESRRLAIETMLTTPATRRGPCRGWGDTVCAMQDAPGRCSSFI